ncbi:acetolactate synthase-1/2/3 large subunit [Cognatiyoonia sediminum]|uniref:Acetolactate synthase-1/2/3 large subunit n=1 Tax=Cognatiyoonia sediminum TaxID=1508389 RepID=A0A1M5T5X0_9RHOB|nr:thiamine pyrophosphate-binding protein [Cognatiyoonia sediminum]SHH46157.1 acetolactate synthase-1/2/3 large subunit [Cognatiyoonia sediminum]
MTKRTGGVLLVDCLRALGARHSFGVPGESYLAILDALYDTSSTHGEAKASLDFTLCRNEGGASFMAAAYGKLTGAPGICFVTRGPGATNASIGVHTAMQDSSPMILFVGQVGTDMMEREAFQEVNYRAYFGSIAKWATEIEQVARIPEIIARAWHTAVTGRPGPVVVALPEDMLTDVSSAEPLRGPAKQSEAAPTEEAIAETRRILESAKRPLIFYGGCNWTSDGSKALQSFAEASDIPVLSVFRYQDQFDNHSPSFCGEAGVGMSPAIQDMMREADVILAINARFGENSTLGYSLLDVPQPKQRIIHVHGSDRELGKVYVPELAIHAGPNAFAAAMAKNPVSCDWSEWRSASRAGYESGFELPDLPSPVDMGKVSTFLRDRLPKDTILTNGAGNFTVWPNKFFKFGPNQRLLAPQAGAMGYGLPAAIAAKTVHPERTVVCFAGDGDFQMNCQELGSAMQSGAQPIVLILNNGTYGTIRMHQEKTYPERVSGTTLENPDFVMLAKSYGYHAERVESTEDFESAFERALASETGAVLDLNVSSEALTPRQSLSQMREVAKSTQA